MHLSELQHKLKKQSAAYYSRVKKDMKVEWRSWSCIPKELDRRFVVIFSR